MSRIFISYRRDDTRWVARALKSKLANAYGEAQVFMDIDSIDPGVDFVEVLEKAISQVDALIAVIGPSFLTVKDDQGNRRIDNPNDFVRLEIGAALKRDIRVIPLLEAGTPLPSQDDLPDDLKPLARRNAVEVGESSFDGDIDRIVKSLDRLWGKDDSDQAADLVENSKPPKSMGWAIPFFSGVAVLAIVGFVLWISGVLAPSPNFAGKQDSTADASAGVAASGPANANTPKTEPPTTKPKTTGPTTPPVAKPTTTKPAPTTKPSPTTPPKTEPPAANPTTTNPTTKLAEAKPPTTKPAPTTPPKMEPPATKLTKPPVANPPTMNPALAKPTTTKPPVTESSVKKPPVEVGGLVWIPSGTFEMGSPEDEVGRRPDEKLHQVTISNGFYLGEIEVTQQQYLLVMGKNPSRFKKDDAPVESVSWRDAIEFCKKLNELTEIPDGLAFGKLPPGFKFTLPTEAQWEYACRAGTKQRLTESQLYKEAVCYEKNTAGWNAPQRVRSKEPNDWELYDMLGNVEELCLDRYGPYSDRAVTDPSGGDGDELVVRGGYYGSSNIGVTNSHNCRAAVRGKMSLTGRSQTLGFRVAAVRSK